MTGSKCAPTRARAGEDRLRFLSSAVEQSPVSIVITDLEGNIEYVNAKTVELTGYRYEELIGQNPRIFQAGETPREEYERMWQTIPHREWRGMFHNRKKNGELFWEWATIRAIRNEAGVPTHYLAVKENITEQRAIREALQASEERFRIAAECSSDVIYEWDMQTNRTQVFGGSRRRHAGALPLEAGDVQEWMRMVHPEDRAAVRAAGRRHLATGEPYRVECRMVLAGDAVRYVTNEGSVIRDVTGKPVKWIGVIRDITDQKIAELANAELAAIVASTDAAVVSKDRVGTILTWNAGAERIFGYSAAEIVGRNVAVLIPEECRAEEAAISQRFWQGEWIHHRETVRLTKSGEPINVLVDLSPIRNREGVVIGAATVATNITQVKQLERRLAQAQKLESIGQLAAGIAHEINTPIQYVGDNGKFLEDGFRDLMCFVSAYRGVAEKLKAAGSAEWAEAAAQVPDDVDLDYLEQEIPKAIGQLLEGVDQVARIVRAMKEFSHPGPVEKVPVNINRAIESTVLVSKNEWKYVADVTTDYDRDMPPVPCMAGEFNQVMLNVLVNAAHAISDVKAQTGRRGAIHVTTRRVGQWAEIRVKDTGGGIPEEIHSRVFDPFFTTKKVGMGTGQGLAIAHSVIAKKHHGTIEFESETGVGTTFVIRLPLEGAREGM